MAAAMAAMASSSSKQAAADNAIHLAAASMNPRLIYHYGGEEFHALRVELKADRVEFRASNGSSDNNNKNSHTSGSEASLTSSHGNGNGSTEGNGNNRETCIMFKLSLPTIVYYQQMDNFTERSFISNHNVTLEITKVENKVTELLGFLPQELERHSLIKFIHPDDLDKMKQIHYDIFDGKDGPNEQIYRWRCRNGCYVSVRTNWSWFIHPWRRQIDFIIGKHVVLTEPINKNIFEEGIISNGTAASNASTSGVSGSAEMSSTSGTPHHRSSSHQQQAAASTSSSEATASSSSNNNNQQQTQQHALKAINSMANSIGVESSNNSNMSHSLVSSSKNAKSSSLVENNGNGNGNSNSSTFLFGFEEKQRVAYMKNVEKDIVEYISRKIPGIDDATQMLGQDMIKYIRRKNLSASYCQNQNKVNKQMKRAEEAARPGFIRPLKRSQQAFDYPVYFNNQYIENKLSRIRLHRPKTGAKKFGGSEIGKSQLKFQQPQRLKFNQNSSSSSNSEFIRVLNRRRKLINMSKLQQQQQQQHRFDAGTFGKKSSNENDTTKSETKKKSSSKLGGEKKRKLDSSEELEESRQMDKMTSEREMSKLVIDESRAEPSNIDDSADKSNDNKEDPNLDRFDSMEPNKDPALYQEIMAKKLSQPSLMDKGFLTHYMICKYIDDLPNSWCTEELTNATGDMTCTAGNESLMETDIRNEHAFSTKGLNDGASACGGGEAMTHESASVSTDDRREKINPSKFVDPVFLGDEQPALPLALPPPAAHLRSSNRQHSPDCLLMGHVKTPPMTPPPLRAAILSRPTEEEIMHITENQQSNEEEYQPHKIGETHLGGGRRGTLMSHQGVHTPTTAATPATSVIHEPTTTTIAIKKPVYSTSSRSQSKIALFDENDDDYEVELESTNTKQQPLAKTLAAAAAAAAAHLTESHRTETAPSNVLKHELEHRPASSSLAAHLVNQQPVHFFSSSSGSQSSHNSGAVANSQMVYPRLTKEALVKHTREQDERYIMEILRQNQQSSVPKRMSENPQNICAQAPNVFSRNEYEPTPSKNKKRKSDEPPQPTNAKITTAANNPTVTPHETVAIKEKETKVELDEVDYEMDAENEILKRLGATYASDINEIDFDDPQLFHEILTKSSNVKNTIDMLNEVSANKTEQKKDDMRLKETQQVNKGGDDKRTTKTTTVGKIDSRANSNATTPTNSSTSNNPDFIKFWNKFIKHGSAIVKSLEECEQLLKKVASLSKKLQEEEQIHLIMSDKPKTSSTTTEMSLNKVTKELKKQICLIAELLSINLGIEKRHIDYDNQELLDNIIKKIYQYLLKSSMSRHLTFYMTRIVPFTSLKVDLSSVEFLQSMYRDIKQLFMDKVARFNKENAATTATTTTAKGGNGTDTSSLLLPPMSSRKESCFTGLGGGDSSVVTTDNEKFDDDLKSSSPELANQRPLGESFSQSRWAPSRDLPPKSSKSNANNLSPNEFDLASNMNTNEFDDSSTYLFDSPTSSFESGDNMSNTNEKSNNQATTGGGNRTKSPATKRPRTESTNSGSKSKIRAGDEASSKSGKTNSSDMNKNNQTNTTSESSKKSSSVEFDDKLCSKLMRNFMDLIKNKQTTTTGAAISSNETSSRKIMRSASEQHQQRQRGPTTSRRDDSPCTKASQNATATGEEKPTSNSCTTTIESVSNEDSKDSKSKSPIMSPPPPPQDKHQSSNATEEDRIEEECIKQLNLNIYNDCLKYLSKFNNKSIGDLESD